MPEEDFDEEELLEALDDFESNEDD